VKGGQEIHPDDVASVVFLRQQDMCEEVVPVKEPPTSEHVQDVKDGRAIVENCPRHSTIPSGLIRLLVPIFQGQRWDLKGGGSDRRGRRWGRGGRGCQFRPLGRWNGRGGQRHRCGLSLRARRLRSGMTETLGTKLSLGRSHRGHGVTAAIVTTD